MKRSMGKVTVISILFLLAAVTTGGAAEMTSANVYDVCPVVTPTVQLIDDAGVLDLNLVDAAMYHWREGWWKLENSQVVIKRNEVSGHFDMTQKLVEPFVREVFFTEGNEPADAYVLQDEALDLIDQLGVPMEEVGRVSVKRIMDQAEDEFGGVGEPTTVNFVVFVHREIDGLPVTGSHAKAAFSPEGELTALTIKWRNVDRQSRQIAMLKSSATLERSGRDICAQLHQHSETPLSLYYGTEGYSEASANTAQEQFAPQYLFRCADEEGPVFFREIDAVESNIP